MTKSILNYTQNDELQENQLLPGTKFRSCVEYGLSEINRTRTATNVTGHSDLRHRSRGWRWYRRDDVIAECLGNCSIRLSQH